jgi:hypothetical protein
MNAVLAGTTDGLHNLATGDVALAGHAITALAVDGARIWAVADRHAIWHFDGAWKQVTRADDVEVACIAPCAGNALVGTFPAQVFQVRDRALEPLADLDQAPGRATWFTPWGGPPETRSLAVAAGGAIFANVHVGGILRSRDGGASWAPTIEARADVHQVVVHPDDPAWIMAATGRGLATSRDGGDSWTFESDGLHGRYLRAVAIAGHTLLLTAATSDSSDRAAIYRRALDATGAFERCRAGLPGWFPENIDTHLLAASGDLTAVGTPRGEVYASRDAGGNWTLIARGLPPVRCVVVQTPPPGPLP